MNCEQAIELLPWWLNGTLEAGERRAVDEHLASCTSCREALEETRSAARAFGQHLPPEVLVARAYGETHDFDPDLADRHLESCPQCAADLELARMSRRLEEDGRIAVMPFATGKAAAARPSGSRIWRSSALAASLVGVLALSGWINSGQRVRSLEARLAEERTVTAPSAPTAGANPAPAPDKAARERLAAFEAQIQAMRETQEEQLEKEKQLRDQLARLEAQPSAAAAAPQINTFVQDVEASGVAERGEPAARAIEVPAGTTASTLLLAAEHPESHRDHTIEVVDAAGKTVWSARGLRRNTDTDDYSVTFPPGFLKPGTYTIRVSAAEGGRPVPTESYTVRVR